jgi:hypothetical protein
MLRQCFHIASMEHHGQTPLVGDIIQAQCAPGHTIEPYRPPWVLVLRRGVATPPTPGPPVPHPARCHGDGVQALILGFPAADV